jgi:hypothetical protein
VFVEPDSTRTSEYESKQRERVEKEGCYLGEPRPADDALVGKEVAFVFREPGWSLPEYLWCAAAAKFGLGLIADGCRSGLLPASTLRSPLVEGLRLMAFEQTLATELWPPDTFRYEPSPISSTSILAALGRHEHLLSLRAGEAGLSAVLQVVIFGRTAYELAMPGLDLREDRAWLFDSLRSEVERLGWGELEVKLGDRAPAGATQLQLDCVLA